MHKQYLATTVYSLNGKNVGELPDWFQTNRIAWVFASRVHNRRRGGLNEQCIVPTSSCKRNLQAVQCLSQSTSIKFLASWWLSSSFRLLALARANTKNIQETRLKELQHSGSLSFFFLIQVYFHNGCQWDYEKDLTFPLLLALPFTMLHFKSSCPMQFCSKSAHFWFCSFRG